MYRVALRLLPVLALGIAIGLTPCRAADVAVTKGVAATNVAPPPELVEAPPTAESKTDRTGPPRITYGCKRIWRCDEQVCEWRRGCWGIYGYMEGPYYSLNLAQRQWERDGWPVPSHNRKR